VAINRGALSGWDNPVVIGGLLLAPVLLTLFVGWERRSLHPLVDLHVLRERNVALPLLSQMLLNGPYMAGLVITSIMLAAVFDYSTTAIALLILPRPVAFAIGAWGADSLVSRLGGRLVVITGGGLVAGGLAVLGAGAMAESLPLVIAGVVMAGAGSGIARPPIIATLTDAVGDDDLGVGTGMLNMAGQIGAAAGISILSALVTETSSPEQFFVVFGVAALVGVVAVLPGAAMAFPPVAHLEPPTAQPTAPYSGTIDSRRPQRIDT
jgi:MFS family permease